MTIPVSFHYHSNKMAKMRAKMRGKTNRIKQLGMVDYSPEKAGVGGSIPSLATK